MPILYPSIILETTLWVVHVPGQQNNLACAKYHNNCSLFSLRWRRLPAIKQISPKICCLSCMKSNQIGPLQLGHSCSGTAFCKSCNTHKGLCYRDMHISSQSAQTRSIGRVSEKVPNSSLACPKYMYT